MKRKLLVVLLSLLFCVSCAVIFSSCDFSAESSLAGDGSNSGQTGQEDSSGSDSSGEGQMPAEGVKVGVLTLMLNADKAGYTVSDCEMSATVVEIPANYENLPVTKIGAYAFSDCSSLERIDISENITVIGNRAFYYCSSLVSIDIPDGVTSIGEDAFYCCGSLKSVNIPGSVTSIGAYAFSDCGMLENIEIPEGVTVIGDYAFRNCNLLRKINIPDTMTNIGANTFFGCGSLIFNEYNNAYYLGNESNPYVILFQVKSTTIESCKIDNNCNVIYARAFRECTSLESIDIPDGVMNIGGYAFDNTYYSNDASNWENSFLYIGNHLIGCRTSFSGDCAIRQGTLTIAGTAFYECNLLVRVKIPDSVTSIGDSAFYGCSLLESIELPDSVTSIGGSAFA